MKKVLIRLIGILVLLGIGWGGYTFFKQLPQRQEQVATTKVRREDVVIRAYSRGELRAVRSVTLTAPNLFSTVQVTRLAPMGALAREKDLIVEFDDSERRAQLEEDMLEVEQIDEQMKKSQADLAIRNNQDQVDLLRTRYAVRRAELEVKRNEIISAIDAKKNLLTLDEQQRRLTQLQSDIKSRLEQAQAELAVLREQRKKSMIDVQREHQRIAQAKVLSSMTGLVAVRQNRSGFSRFGQEVPDIREGDTLQPGMPVADILDLSELEVVAKVGELDRANLHEGQDVLITLDAVPDKKFRGKIKSMSGTASANVFSGDPGKKFDVIFSLDMRELLTGLGVKPDQIRRIMETAERNARRAPAASAMSMMGGGMGGGMPGGRRGGMGAEGGGMAEAGGGMPGAGPPQMFRAPGGGGPGAEGARAEGGGGRGGRGGAGAGGRMSEEDRKKFRAAMEKELAGRNPQDLSAEERQKIFAKLRQSIGGGARKGGERKTAAGGERKGGERGQAAPGGESPVEIVRSAPAGEREFSEQDRANAKLPPPPEEDSQLDVLLRPGLLADVEITVERIPNALHVPAQAIFEKDGKTIVYVQTGKRFEERQVQIAKRSESTMVLAGGVKPGEVIALADPNPSSRDTKKGKGDKKGGPPAAKGMGGMPAGGGGR